MAYKKILKVASDNWRELLLAAVIGAFISSAYSFFWGQYSSSFILLNNTSKMGLDVLMWKRLQQQYPGLAKMELDKGLVNKSNEFFLKASKKEWIDKNITAAPLIGRSDLKNLSQSLQKNVDSFSEDRLIYSIKVKITATDPMKLGELADSAISFIRNGGALLQTIDLFAEFEAREGLAMTQLINDLTKIETELKFQKLRLEGLKKLKDNNVIGGEFILKSQIIGKNKSLPISMQQSLLESEINDLVTEAEIVKFNLESAKFSYDLIRNYRLTLDSSTLGLDIIQNIRYSLQNKRKEYVSARKVSPEIKAIDSLDSRLNEISIRFQGLEAQKIISVNNVDRVTHAIFGIVIGIFFTLLVFLCKSWLKARQQA